MYRKLLQRLSAYESKSRIISRSMKEMETVLQDVKKAIDDLQTENSMLRKKQPVKLTSNTANASDIYAELSEIKAEKDKINAQLNECIKDLNQLRKISGQKCYGCYYEEHYCRGICAGCDYNNGNNWMWRGV